MQNWESEAKHHMNSELDSSAEIRGRELSREADRKAREHFEWWHEVVK